MNHEYMVTFSGNVKFWIR